MNCEELVLTYSRPMEPEPTALDPEGSPVNPVRAVLFDVYGTLIISRAGDISGAKSEAKLRAGDIEKLCDRQGIAMHPDELVERFFHRIESEKKRMGEGGIDYPEVVIDDIWGEVTGIKDRERIRRFALEYELLVNPVYPMPGLSDILQSLKERGIPMGIISNAQFYTPCLFSAYLGKSLEGTGFSADLLFFSYQLGYGKPSMRAFSMAGERLEARGIDKKNALYVGNDMLKDIWPAATEGYQTVLFAGDARSLNLRQGDERCRKVKPDVIITGLRQLLNHL